MLPNDESLDALLQMERQLGRQEGYAQALLETGPSLGKLTRANQTLAKERYMEQAIDKFPLPEPFK